MRGKNYKVVIRSGDVDPQESAIRLRKVFDILLTAPYRRLDHEEQREQDPRPADIHRTEPTYPLAKTRQRKAR